MVDFYPYVALTGMLCTGLMRAYWLHRRMIKRLVLAHEFRDQFIRYCNSEGRDGDTYTWLMLNSNRVQSEMGGTASPLRSGHPWPITRSRITRSS